MRSLLVFLLLYLQLDLVIDREGRELVLIYLYI